MYYVDGSVLSFQWTLLIDSLLIYNIFINVWQKPVVKINSKFSKTACSISTYILYDCHCFIFNRCNRQNLHTNHPKKNIKLLSGQKISNWGSYEKKLIRNFDRCLFTQFFQKLMALQFFSFWNWLKSMLIWFNLNMQE